MIDKKTIKQLRKYPEWKQFREHMFQEIDSLNSVENLQELSNERAGEEAKVRNKAALKLYEIFEPFLLFEEGKIEDPIERVKKIKEKYGY